MASTLFYIRNPDKPAEYLELSLSNGRIWLTEQSGEGMEVGEGELYKLLREYYDETF